MLAMWDRTELKKRGKSSLQNHYGTSVAATCVFGFMSSIVIHATAWTYFLEIPVTRNVQISLNLTRMFLELLVLNLLYIGICRFFLDCQEQKVCLSGIFFGFVHGRYGRNFYICLVRDLKLFFWKLLLFIPGIVKYYEYRMIPYILAEQPDISAEEAFALSKKLTEGQKGDLFFLDLSFLGWELLNVLTLGLTNLFWTVPYREAVWAEVYREIWKQRMGLYETQKEESKGETKSSWEKNLLFEVQ